jgi:pSer/pThr/pTyr-binding forkhead associated (FHA) protein
VVWVDDASVSRRHAVIHVDGDRATIEDCGSKNGTFVDGARVDGAATLQPGEPFWLGEARFVLFRYAAEKTTTTKV